VRNFDASWIQWGSNLSLPAENETFYNFAKLNKTLKELTEGSSAPTSKTEPASKTEQSPQESGSTGSAGAGPYILALIALAIGVVALFRRPKSKA